ncbi:MAG TPA: PilN domain-containing protein [Phycisphaerae bacterium]|nr:PilN domain-containing protein [Phycisphaerae bacterium]
MQEIDFLPERIKAQRARRRRLVRQGYLLLVAVAALGAWFYFGRQRVARAQAELDVLRGRSENMQRQLALKIDLQEQLEELLIKERVSKHLGSRANVLDVADELERLLPASMFLMKLNLDTIEFTMPKGREGATNRSRQATPASGGRKQETVKRVRLLITGMAPDDVAVANFIGQLSASPLFEEVNMGYTKNIVYQKRGAREFQASCYVIR